MFALNLTHWLSLIPANDCVDLQHWLSLIAANDCVDLHVWSLFVFCRLRIEGSHFVAVTTGVSGLLIQVITLYHLVIPSGYTIWLYHLVIPSGYTIDRSAGRGTLLKVAGSGIIFI